MLNLKRKYSVPEKDASICITHEENERKCGKFTNCQLKNVKSLSQSQIQLSHP